MLIGWLAELGCITHRTCLSLSYQNLILLGVIRWVSFVTLNTRSVIILYHPLSFLLYCSSVWCRCQNIMAHPWATVKSSCLNTKMSGKFLFFEKAFLIFAFMMLLRETVIIYHCYYCHLKHKRERIELWCQNDGKRSSDKICTQLKGLVCFFDRSWKIFDR